MEFIGVICSIIGVLFAVYQFVIIPKKEIEETRIVLIALFNTSVSLIDKLIDDLEIYSTKLNGDLIMYNTTLTLNGYQRYLIDMKEKELNPSLGQTLLTSNFNKEIMKEMIISLQKQITSFNKSQAYLDSKFKY